mgnify:CR=1 FL=1
MDEAKLHRAKEWLGTRYVLHPANRVQRIPPAQQQEMHKTDVAATFKRIRKVLTQGEKA